MLIQTETPAPTVPVKESALAIKVIGVGGAGGNAISHLAAQEFPGEIPAPPDG